MTTKKSRSDRTCDCEVFKREWTAEEFEELAAEIGLRFDSSPDCDAIAPKPVCKCYVQELIRMAAATGSLDN